MHRSLRRRWALVLLSFTPLIATGYLQAQDYFRYPPYGAQRGRMVYRDGLFHSERYRWGNGLTPQGAQVLTHAIDVMGPLVPVIVGAATGREANEASRSEPDCSASRSSRLEGMDHYAQEQARANDLLYRTARLADPNFPSSPAASAPAASAPAAQLGPGNQTQGGTQLPPAGQLIEQLKQQYGVTGNPWGGNASAGAPAAPQTSDDARQLIEAVRRAYEITGGKNPWEPAN